MSKVSTDPEFVNLKQKNWYMQEQLNRLEREVQALVDLKERVIVVETFLRVRFPDFRAVDRSFNSFSRPAQSSFEQRSTPPGAGLSSVHARDSPAPSRILGLRAVDSVGSEDDEDDHIDDEDDDDEGDIVHNDSRRRSEMDMGHSTDRSLLKRTDDRSLEAPQAKVTKWLNTQNIDPNTETPKTSSPKSKARQSTKRPKISKSQDDQSVKSSKRTVTKRSSEAPSAIGKCLGKVNGVPCKKVARKECGICHTFVCGDHRYMSITCPNYVESIKDCFKDFEKNIDSPNTEDFYSQVEKPGKDGMGRCVCCTGGKKRKVSRTRCQTCRRYICKQHQVKTVRCEAHRFHSLARGYDESEYDDSSSVSSHRPDIIDHIDAI